MLKTERKKYYKVKEGQTLQEIARYFSVSPYLLARENELTAPPYTGQILQIPVEGGNYYHAKEGDSKALLCGSEEKYFRKNGTDILYIGMTVVLGD